MHNHTASSTARRVILSGCSGGGKSTLLAKLQDRGYVTVAEPGRRLVEAAQVDGREPLPWVNPEAFVDRLVAISLADLAALADSPNWVFFDRGLIDALVAQSHQRQLPLRADQIDTHGFHHQVFLAPPWREIYRQDEARRHDFAAANAEYERLCQAYPQLGFEIIELPKVSTAERADFVLATLSKSTSARSKR